MRYYEFEVVKDRRIIKEKMWGYWNKRIIEDYRKDFEVAVYPLLGSSWSRIVDVSEYKMTNEVVIEEMEDHILWAKENKLIFNANITTDVLERLILKSLLAEKTKDPHNVVFGTEEEALNWLSVKGF
jgi:hypothetical protein